ncbi:putative major facilitator, sugar transporter, MFS transporter superfamily [Helianthus annuus]|nr:putative major facilitator, sugar transporter, MFS transporter superfamily [Helianthus annuus]KAJ0647801.1 putative major facilitator, sugar transporter, MFS transporter superfamily [Helianthus annuus]KAJ0651668.1 putative major facilitator, sugar transporter, MFS transporter superfamily [Helianthus annuus]
MVEFRERIRFVKGRWRLVKGRRAIVKTGYVLSFSPGAGPVPALLLPEIFASRIRAKAVALSLGMHWQADLYNCGLASRFIHMCFNSKQIHTVVF